MFHLLNKKIILYNIFLSIGNNLSIVMDNNDRGDPINCFNII